MEPRERKHGFFFMFSLWGLYLQSSTIRRCEPYVQFLSLLKSTKKIPDFFFVVPILIGVFSLTSFFSELGNGACLALVPHFPHNVVRLILRVEFDILTTIFYHRVSCPALSVLLEISAV